MPDVDIDDEDDEVDPMTATIRFIPADSSSGCFILIPFFSYFLSNKFK